MGRRIVFDISHLVTRLSHTATSGIDRVDLAYARYLSQGPDRACAAAQYGLFRPHVLSTERMRSLVSLFERLQLEQDCADVPEWAALRARLTEDGSTKGTDTKSPRLGLIGRAQRFASQTGYRAFYGVGGSIPQDAIYLNVAQHAFEHHRFFRWIEHRPDVVPVFLIHDLLPLDFPEFFPPGYELRFQRRVETMIARARAIITTSEQVADRIRAEYRERGMAPVPIHTERLGSPLEWTPALRDQDHALRKIPYFLMVSTIEPRKNHALLIEVWRSLVRRGGSPPKLILVGRRGWESEQTLRELDLAPDLQRHVVQVSSLPSAHLRTLMQNATAVLMPSFAEGYGIPVVEALSLGVPVICSDIPVFREISQGRALLRSPIDGKGWLEAIEQMVKVSSELRKKGVRDAREFNAPAWNNYFTNVRNFLETL
ncbi:glycosyltransferase family 4 protein [Bradyrhizobium cenepequi]